MKTTTKKLMALVVKVGYIFRSLLNFIWIRISEDENDKKKDPMKTKRTVCYAITGIAMALSLAGLGAGGYLMATNPEGIP